MFFVIIFAKANIFENMTINERFKIIADTLYSGNKRAFSIAIGISPSVIENVMGTRKGNPSYEVLQKVCANANINPSWLFVGEGEILKPDFVNNYDDDLTTVPVVDIYAAAGGGYLNTDYPEKTGEIKLPAGMLSSRRGNYYCGQVKGDSMYPTLSDGDHIIFRVLPLGDWERIIDNKVYLVIDRSGAAYVKRVRNRLREESRIICISDNKDSRPSEFDITAEDIGNIYQVECRISNNMSNLGDYSYQLNALQEEVGVIKAELDKIKKLK
jgi:phage repressor protein C with HTH and peptisase S24 domain